MKSLFTLIAAMALIATASSSFADCKHSFKGDRNSIKQFEPTQTVAAAPTTRTKASR